MAATWNKLDLAIETTASVTTLAGIALGTTTHAGALCYAVAQLVWWALILRRRLYGLIPLNAGSTLITAWNLAS
jgi:hypothetical protein